MFLRNFINSIQFRKCFLRELRVQVVSYVLEMKYTSCNQIYKLKAKFASLSLNSVRLNVYIWVKN